MFTIRKSIVIDIIMGLDFSTHRVVKNNTLLVTDSYMPANEDAANNLWYLYRQRSSEVKADGFGVRKDVKSKKWKIVYFEPVGPTTFLRDASGRQSWRIDLELKLYKWNEIMLRLIDEVGMGWQPESHTLAP